MSDEGRRIEIRGTVQGVGFRPWVYRLARERGVRGVVRNDARGVTIEAFASKEALDAFVEVLQDAPPPAAEVEELCWHAIPTTSVGDFVIAESEESAEKVVSIPPDLATCDDCLAEIRDPSDRRYRYPFTNCTNCGPRFTIATGIPYDRPATTMATFTMCPDCRAEYDDPSNRRFHAQPNACPRCGPRLLATSPSGSLLEESNPISLAARAIRADLIVAVKGLGGFHLACDATSARSVLRLRDRKKRDEKPFAVMVADLEVAERVAFLGDAEKQLLTSVERPIVLAPKRPGSVIVDEVAPDNKLIGLLLPYTPLHHLLMSEARRPLVMTSGNLSEEPIAKTNQEAAEKLGQIADIFLIHDREVASRADDSVARVIGGRAVVLRRGRGYVPRGIRLARPFAAPVLACGGHLKNTFCLADGDTAYLGPHVGDLETLDTLAAYEEAIETMRRFLGVSPEVVAHDLHPDYASTRYAKRIDGVKRVAVQHHHAHVASAMAEHGLEGPVIGIAFDGTGYGTDGSSWGGEILIADLESFERVATLRAIPLAGGEAAIRQVWRVALAVLDDAFSGEPPLHAIPLFRDMPRRGIDVVRKMIARGFNTPSAHGLGRLFDAVGAIVMERAAASYEGQVAMTWNMAADPNETRLYPMVIRDGAAPWQMDWRPMIRAIVNDMLQGQSAATISARFHNTIASATSELVRSFGCRTGSIPIVLTGGCFQNALLTERIVANLGSDAPVYLHRRVPPGDGGLALGQAIVADAVARLGRDRAMEVRLMSRQSEVEFDVNAGLSETGSSRRENEDAEAADTSDGSTRR